MVFLTAHDPELRLLAAIVPRGLAAVQDTASIRAGDAPTRKGGPDRKKKRPNGHDYVEHPVRKAELRTL
jgi:hypothetical protein